MLHDLKFKILKYNLINIEDLKIKLPLIEALSRLRNTKLGLINEPFDANSLTQS